jgi:hypothetical protein
MEDKEQYGDSLSEWVNLGVRNALDRADFIGNRHNAYMNEEGRGKPTVLYSQQREAYQKLLDQMMEMHIQKTDDYGPDAVNLTGEIGIMVRMVDKMSRLTHLTGWDFKTGTKSEVKSPNNESIDDTLMDLASYALIMLVYRQNKWGK